MPRVVWRGDINFGLVRVPVEAYSATQTNDLDFKLIDRRDGSPVGYTRVNKKTGEAIDSEDVVRAYELESGEKVVVDDEDFEKAAPGAKRVMSILDFVDPRDVDPVYYERPYYLVPGPGAEAAYVVLRQAIEDTHRVGITKVVLRTREHLGALMVDGDMLRLELLRYEHQVRTAEQFSVPGESPAELGISSEAMERARRLVHRMSSEWDSHRYHDTYRDRLLSYIRHKAAEVEPAPEAERVEVELGEREEELGELLERSLEETDRG